MAIFEGPIWSDIEEKKIEHALEASGGGKANEEKRITCKIWDVMDR